MGRKKSKRGKAIKKAAPQKLENRFNCPKCHHEKVVQCKISKSAGIGVASCTVCEATFHCPVNSLDQAIDVYHAWADQE